MKQNFMMWGIVSMLLLLVGCTQDNTGPIGYNPDTSSQYTPVQLITPPNQDRRQNVTMTLVWSKGNEAGVTYTVYLDTHDNPDSVIADNIAESDTVLAVTGLAHAQQYYWKVVANFEGASAESFISEFSTQFKNMTIYNSSNSGLVNNRVLSIAPENSGTVWVGTEFYGLQKMSGQDTWTTYNESNSSLSNAITALAITSDNKKWIGTFSKNVFSN